MSDQRGVDPDYLVSKALNQDRWIKSVLWSKLQRLDQVHDVSQEVYLAVFKGANSYIEGKSFKGWLRKIVMQAIWKYRQGFLSSAPYGPSVESVEGKLLQGQTIHLDHVERIVDRLVEQERAVFILVFLRGYTIEDIIKRTKSSRASVYRLLKSAKENFIERWREEYG